MDLSKDLMLWLLIYFQQKTGSASFLIFLGGPWKWKFRWQKCSPHNAACARHFWSASSPGCIANHLKFNGPLESSGDLDLQNSASLCEDVYRRKTCFSVFRSVLRAPEGHVIESKQIPTSLLICHPLVLTFQPGGDALPRLADHVT